jgi:hypothetical protein
LVAALQAQLEILTWTKQRLADTGAGSADVGGLEAAAKSLRLNLAELQVTVLRLEQRAKTDHNDNTDNDDG